MSSQQERKKKKKKSTLEFEILRLLEKSMNAALKKALDEVFQGWK
jgi:hypothetical protein